jgi:hypothetical protein
MNTANKKCFTCGKPATHKSKNITPAGYPAYQCATHAINDKKLWGSDPGWLTVYEPIEKEKAAH